MDCSSIPTSVLPPAADQFPAYPATWYLFGRARELRFGPVGRDLLGRRLVAFRAESGRIAVLDARCAHLGADLARGRVCGECLQCPFHQWEYTADGQCVRIPSQAEIPAFARQAVYPVVERHGYLFFFNGPKPLFELPFFFDRRPEDFAAGRVLRFEADCSWVMIVSNGFDTEHFRAVHDRTLLTTPVVDCPGPFARRMRYTARVTGHSIQDRLLRWFVGDTVEVAITSWGGPLVLVTGQFRRARSMVWISVHPRDEAGCTLELLVFAPRCRGRLLGAVLQPLVLEIRRWFTRGFMQDDFDRLFGGIRYRPQSLIAGDRDLVEFFRWAAELPQARPFAPDQHNVNGECVPTLLRKEIPS